MTDPTTRAEEGAKEIEPLFFGAECLDRLKSNLAKVDPFEISALISDCLKLKARAASAEAEVERLRNRLYSHGISPDGGEIA